MAAPPKRPSEENSFLGRARRVTQLGGAAAGFGVQLGVNRLRGGQGSEADAKALAQALGQTRGPVMKVAQLLAAIPDFLPEDYAASLATLQANAPPMGWSFVLRRMRAELGDDWQSRFQSFEKTASHAASLGQVHRATDLDGRALAVKLQYPDMASAVEADIGQLRTLIGLFKRVEGSLDPSEAALEVADRLREELDYRREAKAMHLYSDLLSSETDIAVPEPVEALSTGRLLSMTYLPGFPVMAFKEAGTGLKNKIAHQLFRAWWHPMMRAGIIHGDPHMGNYTLTKNADQLNLLDFGCIRIFPPVFVRGVVELYRALLRQDFDGTAAAYEIWGFRNLSRQAIDALNIWARFIFAPLLDDRVRTIADGVKPSEFGRREALALKTQLRSHGRLVIPREFVFMDRAAIGLGSVNIHLGAELNFHQLFEASIADFSEDRLREVQTQSLARAKIEAPYLKSEITPV